MTTFHYFLWFALTLAGFALLQLGDRYYRRKNKMWISTIDSIFKKPPEISLFSPPAVLICAKK